VAAPRTEIRVDKTRLTRMLRREPVLTLRLLKNIATVGKADVINSMRKSPPDDTRGYRKGGRFFQSSIPGNPPRRATGDLIKLMKVKKVGRAEYAIESNAPQSADLEFGNPDDNLLPRPYMGPMAMRLVRKMRGAGIMVVARNYVTRRDL